MTVRSLISRFLTALAAEPFRPDCGHEAAIERVRAIPRIPHHSQQTGELGRAYTRGWESVIAAIDTALNEPAKDRP